MRPILFIKAVLVGEMLSHLVIASALYPMLLILSYEVRLYHHPKVSGARVRIILSSPVSR